MAKRKRVRTGAKHNADPSAKTLDRGSVRTRRSLVVGSIVSAAVVAVGIIVWQLNGAAETGQETPATAGRPDLAHVTGSPKPAGEAAETGPAPRATVEALEKEAFDAIHKLIKALPKSSDPLALMGTVQVMFGNTAEGVQWWERCLKVNPRRPDVYDGLAQVAQAKGQYAKALDLWGKVLHINPRLPGIRNKLAGVLIDSGKMDEAIAVLKKELEISPEERSQAYFLLGKAYLQLQKYDKAQESYEAAVAIRPDYASAWYGLATVHARLGHRQQSGQSMEKFRKYMEVSGESMESRTGRAAGRDGDRSRERSQQELAAVHRLAALAHTSVGAVYSARGYHHRAKPHWQRAAELDPKDAKCRVELAALYRKGGKYEKAIAVCEQLVKIDPTNAVFHSNLGVLYAEMNRLDAALAAAQRAIDLDPDSPISRRVYQQIQKKRKQHEGRN